LDQVRDVAERMRHPPVWRYGPTTIEEAGALVERCVFWTGNDGGAKHIAAAVGSPTLTVIRWRIGPVWTDATAAAPQWFIDHAPPGECDQRCLHCAQSGCLAAITPDEVLHRVRQALVEIDPRA